MHTPVLAQLKGLPANNHEFGIYAEHKTFGKQVDWFLSAETLDIAALDMFVDAIENQTQLPRGLIGGALPREGMPNVGGTDIQLSKYFCLIAMKMLCLILPFLLK